MKRKLDIHKQWFMALALFLATGSAMPMRAEVSVQTNKVWLSGATHIFGRMSVSGISSSSIKAQGFCYSETNNRPTIEDNVCVAHLSNNDNIYNISGLNPSTVYYIRAYVKKTNGDVVYGDPIKAITRPKGGVSCGIRDGFPADALKRIQSASKEAIDLWNEYTGIRGLYVNIGYGADTPTADCSYGGWIRVGPNSSYQKTGTLLHEMLHAIGVGTIDTWYNNAFLRANTTRGYWLGVRATRAVRFWNNSSTEQLNGDNTHMWPYGINGAHEDNGSDILYIGNSVLAEALGEDGLAPTSSQFAIPAYVFEQDDETKYYLKNESVGIGSKFLRISKTGSLQWTEMDTEEAMANDSAAWNVTFDPVTCYYSLKNVATGRYMSYSTTGNNGIKTTTVSKPTAKEKFHFLPSPVEVANIDGESIHGYWVANVQNNHAYCLTAQANKDQTSASSLKFNKEGGTQRWLLLDAQKVKELSESKRPALDKFYEKLTVWKSLLETPHTELEEGADADYNSVLTTLEDKAKVASEDELESLETEAETEIRNFLGKVQATSTVHPFDISCLLQNPDMDATVGWTANNSTVLPTVNYSCGEFYEKNIDLSQKLQPVPAGIYELKVQAFQCPGTTANVYADFQSGKSEVNPYIYLSSTKYKQVICNIMEGAQDHKIGKGKESSVGNQFVPNDMQSASAYFAQGLYENSVQFDQSTKRALTIGLKGTNATASSWTIFDNFRLYYYGKVMPSTGIKEITTFAPVRKKGIYNINGQLVRSSSEDKAGLPSGLYIVDGKKVIIK